MGWIWIGFTLLNTFANCDFYRFFEILTFSAKREVKCDGARLNGLREVSKKSNGGPFDWPPIWFRFFLYKAWRRAWKSKSNFEFLQPRAARIQRFDFGFFFIGVYIYIPLLIYIYIYPLGYSLAPVGAAGAGPPDRPPSSSGGAGPGAGPADRLFHRPFYILNIRYYIININFISYLLNINLQTPYK